ncbi:MAG: helix-turn-helix domain-containing protein, partial [Rubripirellula sp.]
RHWPGNVRELRNAVEHAAVVAGNRSITIEDFPEPQGLMPLLDESKASSLHELVARWTEKELTREGKKNLQPELLSILEPALIQAVLEYTKHNRVQASELLGIHRGTLREKMRNYGLEKSNKADS